MVVMKQLGDVRGINPVYVARYTRVSILPSKKTETKNVNERTKNNFNQDTIKIKWYNFCFRFILNLALRYVTIDLKMTKKDIPYNLIAKTFEVNKKAIRLVIISSYN